MKFLLYTTLIASLFVSNIEAIWVPKQGTTWNYVLKGGEHINVSKETAQVVDLDFTHKSKISELHSKGIKAICYFSGGTLESFRDDKDQYYKVDGLIKTKYEEFSDEIWLDHRKEGLKPLIENRIKRAVSNGCDGLEIDNLGGYKHKEVQKWSDPLTEEDTVRFARWLAKTVHSYGLSIGLKNVLSIVDIVGDDFDYAINESCVVYNECKRYKNFLKKGKAVFGVTYDGVSSNQKGLCSNLNGLGISMIVKSGSSSDGLVQDGVIFDGKKYCGDSFNPGVVASSPAVSNQNSNQSPKKINVTTITSTKTIINRLTISGMIGSVTAVPTGTITGATQQTLISLNNKPKENTEINNPLNNDNNNNNDQKKENDDDNNNKLITGVAVTGSILGAAGVLLLIKRKNPKTYEHIKRGVSRKFSRSSSGNTDRIQNISEPIPSHPSVEYNYNNNYINYIAHEKAYNYSNYKYQTSENHY